MGCEGSLRMIFQVLLITRGSLVVSGKGLYALQYPHAHRHGAVYMLAGCVLVAATSANVGENLSEARWNHLWGGTLQPPHLIHAAWAQQY